MKIIFAISRIFFILFVWTIGYFFWLQRLMLALWGFDPLSKQHWVYIWNEWQSGWVIHTFKEWMFVIILFAIIPVWFTGWTIMCAVPWMKWFKIILLFPIKLVKSSYKKRKMAKHSAKPKVTKKKSYKQTRPPAVRAGSGKIKHPEKAPEKHAEENHAPQPSPAPRHEETAPARQHHAAETGGSAGGKSIMDILRSAGYRLISDAKIAGKKVDFVAVSAGHILLALVDSETGDWLADEERFNDEEPLWFSESNHRISPVRLILNARDSLQPMLTGQARGMEIKPMVIVRQGTIINAEDMFEVWSGLNVTVCRFEDGGPEEIALLPNSVKSVEPPSDDLYHSISGVLS